MKRVAVEEAVGMVLCHDITRIVPGEYKGRAFRKGQRVQPEDIPLLKDLGKQHLFVFELKEGWIHEDDAALRIAHAACRTRPADNHGQYKTLASRQQFFHPVKYFHV